MQARVCVWEHTHVRVHACKYRWLHGQYKITMDWSKLFQDHIQVFLAVLNL